MSWTEVLGKIAPTVVTALAGPLAGGVVALLGEAFGISEPTQRKIKDVIEKGQMTGEQLTALKTLELKLQGEEQERGFKYAELEIRDRESARVRDATIAQASGRNWRADSMYLLAVAIVFLLVYLVWKDGDTNEYVKGIVTLVLGRFLGYLDNIYSYEFGTTRSSQQKNLLLAQAPSIKE